MFPGMILSSYCGDFRHLPLDKNTFQSWVDHICEMKRLSQDSRGSKPEIIFAVLQPLVNPAPTGYQIPKTTAQCWVPHIVTSNNQQGLLGDYSS